jgi:cytochrome c556
VSLEAIALRFRGSLITFRRKPATITAEVKKGDHSLQPNKEEQMNRFYAVAAVLAAVLLFPAAASAQMSDGAAAAPQTLDRMDARRPVPLPPMMANHQKQNMRDHLVAVQEIVAAAARGDFAGVEHAAGRIGYSEQMGQMCTHMGAAAPGFAEQALAFHRMADTVVAAARQHDRDGVLRALSSTLQTCTGCHATWKQEVVDDAAWSRMSGGDRPASDRGTTP